MLRFFAFVGVFLFHFYHSPEFYAEHGVPRLVAKVADPIMYAGVFGVDLFFVLSAYLITELLLREKEQCGELDVRGFYVRRMLRIWPLYFFYIGLALIPLFNPNHVFTWRYAVAFLLLAGNWSIVAWGWPLHSIIGALWTVSIEEQFYLSWPPVVRKLSRNGVAVAAIVMLVISNATRIAMIAVHGGVNSLWCNTLARLDPIAAGILVAVTLRGKIPNFKSSARLLLLCSGILLLVFVANHWQINAPDKLEWMPTLLGFPAIAVGSMLILLAVLGIASRLPQSLLYLGKISYGLYVYHELANFLSGELILVHTSFIQLALRPVLAMGFTIALASASYAILERPFLKLKTRFAHIKSRPV